MNPLLQSHIGHPPLIGASKCFFSVPYSCSTLHLSRQFIPSLYHWGVRRIGNTGNHGKVGVKRKWWVLAYPPYSPQGNGKQSPRVEPFKQGDRPPDVEENPRSWYRQRLGGQA